jgi:hypothetical protein
LQAFHTNFVPETPAFSHTQSTAFDLGSLAREPASSWPKPSRNGGDPALTQKSTVIDLQKVL